MNSHKHFARNDESIERATSSGVSSEMSSLGQDILREWKNLLKNTPHAVKEQVAGRTDESLMTDGQEVSFTQEKTTIVENQNHLKYVHQEIDTIGIETKRREEALNKQQITEVQEEIKKLILASKDMENAFKDVAAQVTVNSTPVQGSTYNVGFFEWVLTSIRQARSRIEDGSTWLAVFSGKQSHKGYWSGTVKNGGFNNIHMSKERSVVTQSG